MTEQEMTTKLGTHLYERYGAFCLELVNAGYDLDAYYDGGTGWGDFSKVLVVVAVLRGAANYDDYVAFYQANRGDNDKLASKQLFARLTKIYTPRSNTTQTDRTRTYRQRTAAELQALRQATAFKWIDENLAAAREYIDNKQAT